MNTAISRNDYFVQQYGLVSDQLNAHALPWLQQKRQQALEHYAATGLPGRKNEEWRYTRVQQIQQNEFKPAVPPTVVDAQKIVSCQLSDAIVLVFVDGFYQANLSQLDDLPVGVMICNLATAMKEQGELIQTYFDSINQYNHGFDSLNTAFFNDGAFIFLPAFVKLEKPIQFIFHGSAPDVMVTPRNLIITEQEASCSITEIWAGTDKPRFCNAMTEVILGNGAQLTIDKVQDEGNQTNHVSSTWSQLSTHAVLTHRNFNFGGQLIRNDIEAQLGDGSSCHHLGLTLVNHNQHTDNHLRVVHQKPDAISRIQYKNIAQDQSRAVFQGRVVVQKDAQKTDSNMSNPNLLLSEDAIIYTKPQLEIDADDVQCAHGVTVGDLDQTALFYLRSRGIDDQTARNILTFGFANEQLEAIDSEELKTMVLNKLVERFPQSAIRVDWL